MGPGGVGAVSFRYCVVFTFKISAFVAITELLM